MGSARIRPKAIDVLTSLSRVLSNLGSGDLRGFAVPSRPGVIHIVGCGASCHAGYALEQLFAQEWHVPVYTTPAHRFAHYRADQLAAQDLVIAISISGEVRATLDAVKVAKQRGCMVVAITGKSDTLLAQASDVAVALGLRDVKGLAIPESFLLTLCSLLLFLEANTSWSSRDLVAQVEAGATVLEALPESVESVEIPFRVDRHFHMVAYGPGYGAALYAADKFYSRTGTPVIVSDVEEFAHGAFYSVNRGDLVVAVAQSGNGTERMRDVLSVLIELGAAVVLLSNDTSLLELPAVSHIRLPWCEERYSAFSFSAALNVLVWHFVEQQGWDHLKCRGGRKGWETYDKVNRRLMYRE